MIFQNSVTNKLPSQLDCYSVKCSLSSQITLKYFCLSIFAIESARNCYRCVQTQIQNDSSCYNVLLDEYHVEGIHSFEFNTIRLAFGIISRDEDFCQSFLDVFLCFFEFPPCDDNTSELLPICVDRCPHIQATYDFCFQGRNVSSIEQVDPALFNILSNFNCSVPETYYFSDNSVRNISSISCSKLIYSFPLQKCVLVTVFDVSKNEYSL